MVGMGLLKSQLKSLFMWKKFDECEKMPGKHKQAYFRKEIFIFYIL